MNEYWPWWIGGLGLGAVVVGFRLLIGRPLGVSGSWAKIAFWKQESRAAREARALAGDQAAAQDAFLAETLAEFGEDAVAQLGVEARDSTPAPAAPEATPPGAHLVFLLSIFAGALIMAMLAGDFSPRLELSELHTALAQGSPWQVWFSLFMGGLMVGVGTQMAGGCTSGHGLSGCAMFAPTSLLATATFFAGGVAVSLVLEVLYRAMGGGS